MRHRVIHLVNPKTDSMTTRPLYLNRALYSPIAGLLAVAAAIPRDRYEVVLTDENIETVDFDLQCDLVGISAMTAYVNRGMKLPMSSAAAASRSSWAAYIQASWPRSRCSTATQSASARQSW